MKRWTYPDTVLTLAVLLGFAAYMGWQAFSHPEWTRTQLFLENWAVCVSVGLILLAGAVIEWVKRL